MRILNLLGQLRDAGVQLFYVLPGGVNLGFHHINLLAERFLIRFLLGLVLFQVFQLGLQLLVFLLQLLLLRLELVHGFRNRAARHCNQHTGRHRSRC